MGQSKVDELNATIQNLMKEKSSAEESGTAAVAEKDSIITDLKNQIEKLNDTIRSATDGSENLQAQLEQSERDISRLRGDITRLKAKMEGMSEGNERVVGLARKLTREVQEIKKDVGLIKDIKLDEMQHIANSIPDLSEKINELNTESAACLQYIMEKYKRELTLRRKYFNQVQTLRGNIRVFCRQRPLLKFELDKGATACTKIDPVLNTINVAVVDKRGQSQNHKFEFDRVFDTTSTQESVCEETSEYVHSVLDGYNVSIFAYGLTGSGKTYTMDGPDEKPGAPVDLSLKGVNFNALRELFKIARSREPLFEYDISMACLEVYNEKISDLLDPETKKLRAKGKWKDYKVVMTPDGGTEVRGLTWKEVNYESEVLVLISVAKGNRASSKTSMNERSSRSHMIIIVKVEGENLAANLSYDGQLYLVDLAGCERVGKSGVTGQALKEAQGINKSLSAWGNVMNALQKKSKHIPYRDSTLTHVMKASLGGNAKTIMFLNCCPTKAHADETFGSLQFAQRVGQVELGPSKAKTKARS